MKQVINELVLMFICCVGVVNVLASPVFFSPLAASRTDDAVKWPPGDRRPPVLVVALWMHGGPHCSKSSPAAGVQAGS